MLVLSRHLYDAVIITPHVNQDLLGMLKRYVRLESQEIELDPESESDLYHEAQALIDQAEAGEQIKVSVVSQAKGKTRLGFECSKDTKIIREELMIGGTVRTD